VPFTAVSGQRFLKLKWFCFIFSSTYTSRVGILFYDSNFSVNSSLPQFTLKSAGHPRTNRTRSVTVRDQLVIFQNSSSFGLSACFFNPLLSFYLPFFLFSTLPLFLNLCLSCRNKLMRLISRYKA